MAVEEDDSTWVKELESALSEECNSSRIHGICHGQALPEELRAETWKACLGIKESYRQITFDEIFDLPEQNILREDCQQFVDKLGNDDEDKLSVLCDLESVLTYHRRTLGPDAQYTRGNGWVELLLPLIALKLPRDQTCSLFQAVVSKYVPSNNNAFHLFRLLLLYHDPQLCSFLDTKRITPEKYASTWFQSLFAATCNLPVVMIMWDLYFQKDDCFFLLFLGLVMVVNSRDLILEMSGEDKTRIAEVLTNLPCGLEAEDVEDFCSLAQYYANKTPSSFREEMESSLFTVGVMGVNIAQALCLPVSAGELIENTSLLEIPDDTPRFFLVDCRPADQYNAGHLPTAFHLDCNLMLQEPVGFATAVQGLLSCQRQAIAAGSNAGGEHLCFLGCGRLDDDQYTHMVVASFLQKHTQYVSLLTGGYQAIHHYLGERVSSALVDHSASSCSECVRHSSMASLDQNHLNGSTSSSSSDLFGKIGAAVKLKSAEVKDKFLEYIVNPSGGNVATSDRHVSASDKLGKRYRNMAPVFGIDDDLDSPDMETDGPQMLPKEVTTMETVSLSAWLKKPEVVATFKCQEVNLSGQIYESHLLVTGTHVYVLRETKKKDMAQVVVRRPLSNIAKITCRKKNPELITFKYGSQKGEDLIISDMDRFLIPQAAMATKIISDQIVKNLEEPKENT